MSLDTLIEKTKKDIETMKLRLNALNEEITQALMKQSEKMTEYSELLELLELARLPNDSPPQEDSTSDDPIPEASAPKVKTILRSKKPVVVPNAVAIMDELALTLVKGDGHGVHLNGRGADRNGRRNKSHPDPSKSDDTIFSLIQQHLTSGNTSSTDGKGAVAAISSTETSSTARKGAVAAISSTETSSTARNGAVAAVISSDVSSSDVISTETLKKAPVAGEGGWVYYAGRLQNIKEGKDEDAREEWGKSSSIMRKE